MMTDQEEARAIAKQMAAEANAIVIMCHTKTKGLMGDIVSCLLSRLGCRTAASDQVVKAIHEAKEAASELGSTNPIVCINHSRGNLYTNAALCGLDSETRSNLTLIGIGSPILRYSSDVGRREFYISEKDWIPMFSAPIDRIRAGHDMMPNVHILPSSSSWWQCDHSIQGKTYQGALQKIYGDMQEGKL